MSSNSNEWILRFRTFFTSSMKVKKTTEHSAGDTRYDKGDENKINFSRQLLAFFSLLVLSFFLKNTIGCMFSHNKDVNSSGIKHFKG